MKKRILRLEPNKNHGVQNRGVNLIGDFTEAEKKEWQQRIQAKFISFNEKTVKNQIQILVYPNFFQKIFYQIKTPEKIESSHLFEKNLSERLFIAKAKTSQLKAITSGTPKTFKCILLP